MAIPKLHYETVSPLLLKILTELMNEPIFNPFYLVGGTSLSLRLGHRKSIDIDLFTNAEYGSLDFNKIEEYLKSNYDYYDCPDKSGIVGFGRSYYIGNTAEECIKLDLFYNDEIICPCDLIDNIRIASINDVIAMKVNVISNGGRKKDFWDIHEILDKYDIEQLFSFHKERHEYTHDRAELLNKFTDFSIADKDFDPICLKNKNWHIIKLDIYEMIKTTPL